MKHPEIGSTAVCAETGETFTVASDGCSFNYATTLDGSIVSDKGVNIRETRELLDRTRPFFCYISSDGERVTGWKGNSLGNIIKSSPVRVARMSFTHGNWMLAIRVCDVHGGQWYGRGSPGACVTLRACK